ncbi:hypothetical protein BDY21DRAFT_365101 [Lineolata rhizophorae]|uniref:Uncharacterized protein n=1 Tax=Lineolata rhizophorae TaxID=578093 RepID=A0A6A6NVX3_9PEZI|nr:hypothetical protein BDY21DRAFT_365101 [Lineolata rhizophorae]
MTFSGTQTGKGVPLLMGMIESKEAIVSPKGVKIKEADNSETRRNQDALMIQGLRTVVYARTSAQIEMKRDRGKLSHCTTSSVISASKIQCDSGLDVRGNESRRVQRRIAWIHAQGKETHQPMRAKLGTLKRSSCYRRLGGGGGGFGVPVVSYAPRPMLNIAEESRTIMLTARKVAGWPVFYIRKESATKHLYTHAETVRLFGQGVTVQLQLSEGGSEDV